MFTKKPWIKRSSIYKDLKSNFDVKDYKLPDEVIRKSAVGFGWAPGALDGIFSHHVGRTEVEKEMAQLLKNIAIKGKLKDKVKFYKILEKDQISSYIDSFIENMIKIKTPKSNFLYEWTNFLILESPDRGAVKIGIALAGVIGYSNFIEDIKILGKHEEFTLYASVAIMNLSENPEFDLWELAKTVHGWGRIHLVERLAHTKNLAIKEWILREGYKNNIMYEYLALIAAETGELHVALNNDEVDNDLLISASEIINALIAEGPCAGISAYEHGYSVITRYLELSMQQPKNIEFILTYNQINNYIESLELNDFELEQGWNDETLKAVRSILSNCLKDDSWKNYILSLINTDDREEFWKVNQAAKIYSLDMKNVHWKKVMEDPYDSSRWYQLIESYGDNIDNDLLEYARSILPLSEMCSGAQNEMGLGSEYRNFSILMFILQALRNKKGLGKDFVLFGLKSPVINNRNMAINVIESWPKHLVDKQLFDEINLAINSETDNEVKKRLEKLASDFDGQ